MEWYDSQRASKICLRVKISCEIFGIFHTEIAEVSRYGAPGWFEPVPATWKSANGGHIEALARSVVLEKVICELLAHNFGMNVICRSKNTVKPRAHRFMGAAMSLSLLEVNIG